MIVALQRLNTHYYRVFTHYDGLEPWWLSPGGYGYLRSHYNYRPLDAEIVPVVVVEQMKSTGHIRRLRDAPLLGTFLEPFRMEPQSRACAIM